MTEFKNSSSIKTSISFSSFLNQATPSSGMRKQKGMQLIELLSGFGSGKMSAQQVLSNMRTTEDTSSIESVQEFFDQNEGTYAWSPTQHDWVKTTADNKIVFQFPSTEAGTSNNATFTIFDYKGVMTSSEYLDDYTGDLPTQVMAELAVNGNKELTYSYKASFNSNGDPTSVETILTINAFKLSVGASNDTKAAKADYSLKKGDKVLIAFGSEATGNFASNHIINSEDAGAVVETSSAYFQLMNIKMAGNANVKTIDAGVNGDLTLDQEIELINTNYKFMVFYVDSNKKIADTEIYKGTVTREQYDPATGGYIDVTDEEANIRLVFADNSKADLETYTNTGFAEITEAFNNFAEDLSDDIN
jgi:hypothetical protein